MAARTVVVGYGSIGARHARLLDELGCGFAVVSRREIDWPRRYPTLLLALEQEQPEYVVIANRTSEHYETLAALAASGYRNRVLIEKPLFDSPRPLPDCGFAAAFVAYNLRFHPAMTRLRTLLDAERVVSAQVYVGQYLPDWRPGTDYRRSYSARVSEGGGVLRDLSHELDYVRWLFGGWTRLAALGGRYGHLEIETDDVCGVLLETPRCPVVTVQMNYLDRLLRREIVINTTHHTFKVDLAAGTLGVDARPPEALAVPRDFTYRAQHEAVLSRRDSMTATVRDGMAVMEMIAAAESAARLGAWVSSECAFADQ